MSARPTAGNRERCSNCNRRLGDNRREVTHDGKTTRYCIDRAACRRASHAVYGPLPKLTGASTEALGAAIEASDYVPWPWWARLLTTRAARDEMAGEFAAVLAAAVENHVCNHETKD